MEEKLIKEAVSGNKDAFCRLYGLYKDRLYRYALYRLKDPDDAEDAVSDCVLAAWQGICRLRSSDAFGAWIFRILSSCCSRRIREIAEQRGNLEQIYDEAADGISGRASGEREHQFTGGGYAFSSPSLAAELSEALSQLKDDEREIVLLSVTGGLSSKEIAAHTGLTAGSVRSKLSRSLAKMREFLS